MNIFRHIANTFCGKSILFPCPFTGKGCPQGWKGVARGEIVVLFLILLFTSCYRDSSTINEQEEAHDALATGDTLTQEQQDSISFYSTHIKIQFRCSYSSRKRWCRRWRLIHSPYIRIIM